MNRKDVVVSVVYTKKKQIQLRISIQYLFFICHLLSVAGRSYL